MQPVFTARYAMASRFEIMAFGSDPLRVRAASEEALDEVDRLEAQLSPFRPTSEISRVNARADRESVRVDRRVFAVLSHARQVWTATGGAFDPTVGALMTTWGFRGSSPALPGRGTLAQALESVGMQWVHLERATCSVRFLRRGPQLDLGAMGKGVAVQVAADILREAGLDCFLVHAGCSSVVAAGAPEGGPGWPVALPVPEAGRRGVTATIIGTRTAQQSVLTRLWLRDKALSVSALWGRQVTLAGQTIPHVLDPRSGLPARGPVMAAVACGDAAEADALSTALLVGGERLQRRLHATQPGMGSLIVESAATPDAWQVASVGMPDGTCQDRPFLV